jgi:hypothetical protein
MTEKVINVNGTTIMWDIFIIKDQTIPANEHDIVLYDKIGKTCLMSAIAIPGDLAFSTKETEKLSKYKDLEIKVSRM